ncbi:uncharacterized protein EV154DRAFT_481617 [Mucor mucedo]|uniref:uncharacterized protein n=1 Tax=Mucor mucedo TaxID=29922 RepID=UPI002220EFA3|nr:uncharacterized protein EV154DRAFT_481617 [Mucor mucedo]KAI7890966.1 hypothetical protein EV154DRAFT_481617 [Mucor mucedo]
MCHTLGALHYSFPLKAQPRQTYSTLDEIQNYINSDRMLLWLANVNERGKAAWLDLISSFIQVYDIHLNNNIDMNTYEGYVSHIEVPQLSELTTTFSPVYCATRHTQLKNECYCYCY